MMIKAARTLANQANNPVFTAISLRPDWPSRRKPVDPPHSVLDLHRALEAVPEHYPLEDDGMDTLSMSLASDTNDSTITTFDDEGQDL